MSRGLYLTAGFILGAITGAVGTWYYLKDQYEQKYNEDLQARREAAAKEHRKEKEEEPEKTDSNINVSALNRKPNIMEYAEKLHKEGYTNYSGSEDAMKRIKETEPEDEPYVIPPEIYDEGEDQGFEHISLTYYSDGVVADDADEILEDVDMVIGDDFAEHYGDYEDDVVYVRNEARHTDYEVCKDNRTYEEVSGKKPHRVEI